MNTQFIRLRWRSGAGRAAAKLFADREPAVRHNDRLPLVNSIVRWPPRRREHHAERVMREDMFNEVSIGLLNLLLEEEKTNAG